MQLMSCGHLYVSCGHLYVSCKYLHMSCKYPHMSCKYLHMSYRYLHTYILVTHVIIGVLVSPSLYIYMQVHDVSLLIHRGMSVSLYPLMSPCCHRYASLLTSLMSPYILDVL